MYGWPAACRPANGRERRTRNGGGFSKTCLGKSPFCSVLLGYFEKAIADESHFGSMRASQPPPEARSSLRVSPAVKVVWIFL